MFTITYLVIKTTNSKIFLPATYIQLCHVDHFDKKGSSALPYGGSTLEVSTLTHTDTRQIYLSKYLSKYFGVWMKTSNLGAVK